MNLNALYGPVCHDCGEQLVPRKWEYLDGRPVPPEKVRPSERYQHADKVLSRATCSYDSWNAPRPFQPEWAGRAIPTR